MLQHHTYLNSMLWQEALAINQTLKKKPHLKPARNIKLLATLLMVGKTLQSLIEWMDILQYDMLQPLHCSFQTNDSFKQCCNSVENVDPL